MAGKGPVPKRTEDRLGHPRQKAELNQVTKAPGAADVAAPEPREEWHPIAQEWYRSLAASGQSQFYQMSDWWTAHYVAEAMHRSLSQGPMKISGQLFQAVMSAAGDLMTTEGSRRRLRLELQRPVEGGDQAPDKGKVTLIDDYRELYG